MAHTTQIALQYHREYDRLRVTIDISISIKVIFSYDHLWNTEFQVNDFPWKHAERAGKSTMHAPINDDAKDASLFISLFASPCSNTLDHPYT